MKTVIGIEFELPWPVSTNMYYRSIIVRGHVQVLISKAGRLYRQDVGRALFVNRIDPLAGPLAMDLDLYPPDNRKRDVDNVQKPILDSLKRHKKDKGQLAWLFSNDDSQVRRLLTEFRTNWPAGKVVVRVRSLVGVGDNQHQGPWPAPSPSRTPAPRTGRPPSWGCSNRDRETAG